MKCRRKSINQRPQANSFFPHQNKSSEKMRLIHSEGVSFISNCCLINWFWASDNPGSAGGRGRGRRGMTVTHPPWGSQLWQTGVRRCLSPWAPQDFVTPQILPFGDFTPQPIKQMRDEKVPMDELSQSDLGSWPLNHSFRILYSQPQTKVRTEAFSQLFMRFRQSCIFVFHFLIWIA